MVNSISSNTVGDKHTQVSYFTATNTPSLETPQHTVFDSSNMSRDCIRRHIRQQRNALSHTEQQQLATTACQHLLAEIVARKATKVALYLAFDGELSTQPLIDALWQQNIAVYLPRIHPFAKGHLLFVHYTPSTPMVHNRFNIAEPKLDVRRIVTSSHLDMIVTPLVAFDVHGNRMGMGGGFYDRTLVQIKANNPIAIGYAHDCQQVSQVPTQYWDIPLPLLFTPTKRIASSHLRDTHNNN
ncbi:5-formyltetrahydrofolate cyclo-ligase [Shewanella intestini]|nr:MULTISPECIES: 5-formyltetrahydrofolate cyclo-ligase [Shewanella]